MEVNRPFRIAATAFLVAIFSPCPFSQSHQSSYGPAPQQQPSKLPDGFVDFALKHINPSEKDYGQCVDAGRAVLLKETVRNRYFWSNVAALGLLGCLLVIIILQHRIGNRRKWVTAEILAQFEQSLRRSKAQVDEATQRNHAFKEALASLRKSTMQPILPHSGSPKISGSAVAKSHGTAPRAAAIIAEMTSAKVVTTRNRGGAIPVEHANQMALFKSDTALSMKVDALEQQLVRAEEQEKELRRQLNEAGGMLQAEQEKNRALKAAQMHKDL